MERHVTLVDGTEIAVRPITPADRGALQDGFDRLGPESRYTRFLAPMGRLSASQLKYLTDVDHHDHEALVAYEPSDRTDGIGVARFVRLSEDPGAAEFAVTVADDWQGRGVGTALLTLLADRAREEGIDRFRGLMLARNEPVQNLVGLFGEPRVLAREPGTIEVEVDLPEAGAGHHLERMLRAAARGETALQLRAADREGAPG
jgi:GNAT superfamily N-acetyltransferase